MLENASAEEARTEQNVFLESTMCTRLKYEHVEQFVFTRFAFEDISIEHDTLSWLT